MTIDKKKKLLEKVLNVSEKVLTELLIPLRLSFIS